MSFPTFLGIGVPRAGTTWLHHLLDSHPDVYMPGKRKEIHFFNYHHDRGPDWYGRFFPTAADRARYRAVGEIGPDYLYCSECPERIHESGIRKLLLILRNPVDRARSHYGLLVRNGLFTGSFEEFVSDPAVEAVKLGYYARGLSRYLDVFRRDELLVLLYEEAVADMRRTSRVLGDFLDLDASKFPTDSAARRVNMSYRPRLVTAFSVAHRVAKRLRRLDQDWVVNAAKHLGVPKLFGNAGSIDSMAESTRARLAGLYEEEVGRMEELLGRPLDIWRSSQGAPSS